MMKPWNRLFSLRKIYKTGRMRFWQTQSFLNFQKVQNGKYCKNLVWKTNFQHAVTFQLFLKAFLSKIQKLLFPKEILLFSSLPHRHVNHTLTFENPLVSQSHKTSPDLFCCVLFSLLSHWKVHEDFFRNERHEVSWKKWMRHLYITLVRSSRRKTYNTRSRKRHEKLLECCNWHIFLTLYLFDKNRIKTVI